MYRIQEFDFTHISDHSSVIKDLRNQIADGFIIRNVLSEDEIKSIVKSYDSLDDSKKNFANEALALYPMSFAQLDQNIRSKDLEMKEYFESNNEFWSSFGNNFGIDLIERLSKTLSQLNNNHEAQIPTGFSSEGIYNPATFKELLPIGEGGELKPHCGNYFHSEFGIFFDHLSTKCDIYNQLSYFMMLDPSEQGGELVLYDVLWDDVKVRMNDDTTLKDESGNLYDLNNVKEIKRIVLKPNPGDMVVFSGGRIWHKINFVKGNKRRLTIGGFLSFSKSDDSVYYWS